MNNNDGFTLINSLFRLFVIAMSIPLLVVTLSNVKVIPSDESLQIQQLFYLIQQEINRAERMYANENRLFLQTEDDELAFFELYGNTIRRRVENRGHEIYARNIHTIYFEDVTYGIRMTIHTEKGETYERTFVKL